MSHNFWFCFFDALQTTSTNHEKNATYEKKYIYIVTQKKTEKVQCITILVGFYQLLSFWFWGLLYCVSFNLCRDIVGCSWGQEQDRTKGGEANATPRERGHWVGSLQTGFGKQSKEARTIGDIPYRCISSIVIYIYTHNYIYNIYIIQFYVVCKKMHQNGLCRRAGNARPGLWMNFVNRRQNNISVCSNGPTKSIIQYYIWIIWIDSTIQQPSIHIIDSMIQCSSKSIQPSEFWVRNGQRSTYLFPLNIKATVPPFNHQVESTLKKLVLTRAVHIRKWIPIVGLLTSTFWLASNHHRCPFPPSLFYTCRDDSDFLQPLGTCS